MLVLVATFVWFLGLAVGSFLNVVVYRLPRGLSIDQPRRSFCPQCRRTLRWFENVPVVSWLALRARCRTCRAPISLQYPFIEAITGLTFVLAYVLLFAEQARFGLGPLSVHADWAILLAWLVLAAALVACSAMDLVSYLVDVNVTNVAAAAGVVLMAAWTRSETVVETAAQPVAAAGMAAFAIAVLMLWRTVWRVEDEEDVQASDHGEPPGQEQPRAAGAGGFLAVAVFVALGIWLVVRVAVAPPEADSTAAARSLSGTGVPLAPSVVAAVLAIFAVLAIVAGQAREADEELYDAIEEESASARRVAFGELGWLLPSIVGGAIAWLLVANVPAAERTWAALVAWTPAGAWAPFAGIVYAALGAAAGAALGWAIRIGFTLVFGREAFGVGDIYILAAAGACGGWDIALLGFLLAVGIALASWLLSLLLKQTAMVAFGPPLALGFLVALWLNRPAVEVWSAFLSRSALVGDAPLAVQLTMAGILLIGVGVAVLAARLVRRLVEPADQETTEGTEPPER